MNWAQWILIAIFGLTSITAVATVGQERKPRSGGEAALALAINIGLAWLVVKAGS
jgi:hypothetical protein